MDWIANPRELDGREGRQLDQLHFSSCSFLNNICVFITQTNPNDVDISEDEFLPAWDWSDEIAK